MGKLTCGCLNVKIHVKSTNLQPTDVSRFGISTESSEEFFSLELAEVNLNLEGIEVEHSSLLKKSTSSEGWLVHQCVNCEMFTHATLASLGPSRLLVNTSLKSDPSIIERLSTCSDYSPLYKIVLRHRMDNVPVQTLGVQSEKYESLQNTLSTIQQQLNRFLQDEEAAMEVRIRRYEESQRAGYAQLQSKARRDKNAMIGLILTAAQSDPSGPPKRRETTRSVTPPAAPKPEPMTENPSPADRNMNPRSPFSSAMKKTTPPKKPVVTRPAPPPQPAVVPDADGLFDFDPAFNDEADTEEPFYESDDSTDDSSITEETSVPVREARDLYSSSVPISMPMWRGSAKRSMEEPMQARKAAAPAMEDMAASMKALARSVHEDGTEMFGDLPRPRIIRTEDIGNI